ncbi:hypothetical protein [Brevundimonas sp. FT23042]|uniref:hypothetical protein n=1 Tax=Brevundimonas sp. FT23042 TaxID=3393749 RepID=UPI003B58A382
MSRLLPLAVVLAMSVAPAALAQDHGRGGGHDNGKGGGRSAAADRGQDHGRGNGNGNGNGNAGRGDDRARPMPVQAQPSRSDRGPDRSDDNGRGQGRGSDRTVPVPVPMPVPGRADADRIVREVVRLEPRRDSGLIAGCPPGLARKDNGCLPPGQARRIEAERRARYDYVWDRWARDGYRYRYDDGYLYRMNSSGGLLGWLPVLGGALSTGSVWPTQYSYQPAPTYFTDYYRLPDRYDYRYADGVLYGVDRQNNGISQIAALLTGQQWNVGQAMPSGYDIYNVPYDYRARYYDTPDRWYRYNDGYVYQVDPTTRLVQAVIQLLA